MEVMIPANVNAVPVVSNFVAIPKYDDRRTFFCSMVAFTTLLILNTIGSALGKVGFNKLFCKISFRSLEEVAVSIAMTTTSCPHSHPPAPSVQHLAILSSKQSQVSQVRILFMDRRVS